MNSTISFKKSWISLKVKIFSYWLFNGRRRKGSFTSSKKFHGRKISKARVWLKKIRWKVPNSVKISAKKMLSFFKSHSVIIKSYKCRRSSDSVSANEIWRVLFEKEPVSLTEKYKIVLFQGRVSFLESPLLLEITMKWKNAIILRQK